MANRLTKTGEFVVIPGVPTIPGRPAYCTDASTGGSGYDGGFGSPTGPEIEYPPEGGSLELYYDQNRQKQIGVLNVPNITFDVISFEEYNALQDRLGSGGSGGTAGGFVPRQFVKAPTAYREVCYPAIDPIPGSPSQVTPINNVGWNAGGRSIDQLVGDGDVAFEIKGSPIGVVVGLVRDNRGDTFADASHAFYITDTAVSVLESGIVQTVAPFAHSVSNRYVIRRIGDTIQYYLEGNPWVYTSSAPQPQPVYLDAAMYGSGDYVDNPEFNTAEAPANTGEGDVTLPAFKAVGSETTYSQGETSLPAFTASGTGAALVIGAVTLPAFTGVGSETGVYSQGDAELPAFRAQGEGGAPQFTFVFGAGYLPAFVANGVSITGEVGTGAATLPSFAGIGSEGTYAQGAVTAPAFRALGFGGFGENNALYQSSANMNFLLGLDQMGSTGLFFAVINDTLQGDSTEVTFIVTLDDDIYDALLLEDTLTFTRFVDALLNEELFVSTQSLPTARALYEYATNIATGAVSRYENFQFDRYLPTRFGLLGVRADGLYQIGNSTDDGNLITALIDMGSSDFGEQQRKRAEQVYLGMNTDGQVYVKMTADDGIEKTYRAVERDNILRATPGKGLIGREWRVILEIVDASSMELDGVDFILNTNARRWTR